MLAMLIHHYGRTHLLCQFIHLLRCQSSVGEHANLASDMAPVMFGSEALKLLLQQGAHADNAIRHALDFTQPLLVQGRVVEDLGCDTGTVDRRVGVERSDKNLDLRINALLLCCVGTDDREGSDTLTVEALRNVS